jgi:hypothetical protein
MLNFDELELLVKTAVENDTVIRIHPLDMAELLDDNSSNEPIDIINARAFDSDGTPSSYIIIGDKVYSQTISAVRTGNTIIGGV